ncbi:hypothetical protein IE53DRAFT_328344 [Violaceomyces palustris]|uniref:Uncharacterized protein n=1 Tax=Violaceomyces palustris TaxID=1673888 RepID=A0ACD0P0G7_9BASI|nr:hypothetical protein IE53DRAFT_328344 [Violaceomyces palustris]
MTRYTKMEKRKPSYLAATKSFSSPPSPEPRPSTSSNSDAPTGHRPQKRGREERTQDPHQPPVPENASESEQGQAQGQGQGQGQEQEQEQPLSKEKLLKKAKLMRLKSKKAKDETSKKRFSQKARELENKASAMQGAAKEEDRNKRVKSEKGDGLSALSGEKAPENPWKAMEKERRIKDEARKEERREKRAKERESQTRCYACRGLGHTAKDCPEKLDSMSSSLNAETDPDLKAIGFGEGKIATALIGRETVGICFRCGSTQHNLSKCRRPAPTVGSDLPFAICYICGQKGHLASKCPDNKGRGVYPNGGNCKICQEVDHLAKDCPMGLRKQPGVVADYVGSTKDLDGTDQKLGADDDHFHQLARKRVDVENQRLNTRSSPLASAAVKSSILNQQTKKTVSF